MTGGWGREVIRDSDGCLVYVGRRHSLLDLLAHTTRWGERTYLAHGERSISFREAEQRSRSLAAHLATNGVSPGSRVALLTRDQPDDVIAFWAVLLLGGVVVLGSPRWDVDRAYDALSGADPGLVIAGEAGARLVPRGMSRLGMVELRHAATRRTALRVPPPKPDERAPAVVLFTERVVGAPRGIVLSHRAVIANVQSVLAVTGRLPSEIDDGEPGAAAVLNVPLSRVGGLQLALTSLITGGRLDFPNCRCHPAATLASRAFPGPRGGVAAWYGTLECGGVVTTASEAELAGRPGTAGRPVPAAEVVIDAPDAHRVGEILVRSPAMMSGYPSGAGSTATFTDDGFLRTGDRGRLDDHGYLYVIERGDSGGQSIRSGSRPTVSQSAYGRPVTCSSRAMSSTK
jgi:long-chain acyl-CoA synthetase